MTDTENTENDRKFARNLFGAQEPNWISNLLGTEESDPEPTEE